MPPAAPTPSTASGTACNAPAGPAIIGCSSRTAPPGCTCAAPSHAVAASEAISHPRSNPVTSAFTRTLSTASPVTAATRPSAVGVTGSPGTTARR